MSKYEVVEFFNVKIDEPAPTLETVVYRDKRFLDQALRTGTAHLSAVRHGSVEHSAQWENGGITETVRFLGKVNRMTQEAAVMAGVVCIAVMTTLVLWGR